MKKKSTRAIGKEYEERAKTYMENKGYEIIEQNWQCGKIGELDFVIKDHDRFKEKYLVFVEVKYREEGLTAAMQAVNYKKQQQLVKLSRLYLKTQKLQEGKTNISYDVIAVSPYELKHVKNIF